MMAADCWGLWESRVIHYKSTRLKYYLKVLNRGEQLSEYIFSDLAYQAELLCRCHRKTSFCENTGEICCDGHEYLFTVLRLAYEGGVTDRHIVSLVLREIFLCEGSLKSVFGMLFTRTKAAISISWGTFILYPERKTSGKSKSKTFDPSALEYFVTSVCPLARDSRETDELEYTPVNVMNAPFTVKDEVFTPLQAAARCGDPELVLLLLRHGADPLLSCMDDDDAVVYQKSPVAFTVDNLNISNMLKDSSWTRSGPERDISSQVDETAQKSLQCMMYFSRAVFALDVRESSQTVDTTGKQADDLTKKFRFEVLPSVAEAIGLASFRQPPTLCHACRCVIRDKVGLAAKETIPEGLRRLKLPQRMIEFLDLQS